MCKQTVCRKRGRVMSRISEIAKEMKTWWGNDGSDIEVQNALDEIIRLDEATDHEAEQTEPMETTDYCKKCNHKGCETCAADGSNPYCVPSRYEPKKKSCADCEYHDWEVDEHIGFRSVCNGIGKCPNKIEPQTEECPFDDAIPCEWVNCPNSTDCPYKPQTERSE